MATYTATSTISHTGLEWVVRDSSPPGWPEALQVCGGGFFHSPAGLHAGAPKGNEVFVDLWRGNELVGIAAGVRHACRISARPQHVYFPTLPAIRDPRLREAGLASLCDAMRSEGADEIIVDSFDASWNHESITDGVEAARRIEHVVRLQPSTAAISSEFSSNHRRQCARGEKLGWSVRAAHGAHAAALIAGVQKSASARAVARGNGFEVDAPHAGAFERSADDDAWGMTAFGGWDGDTLLASVVIGWANRRAFYVAGGSTPEGYTQGASAWLHWRVMNVFAERGFTAYNFGGTPVSASAENNPSHGLWRFKTGFGTEPSLQRSLRWEFDSPHMRGHRVKNWMSRRYQAWLR